MRVSKIVKNNLDMDSKSYTDLSPKMKEAVSDVFKLIKREKWEYYTGKAHEKKI